MDAKGYLAKERAAGLLRSRGTTMYVTRGVGEGMPIRFRSPREMPLITLRRESGSQEGPTATDQEIARKQTESYAGRNS